MKCRYVRMSRRVEHPSLDGKIEPFCKASEVVEEANGQRQLNDLGIVVIAAHCPKRAVVDTAELRREFIAYLRANPSSRGREVTLSAVIAARMVLPSSVERSKRSA
jgi:hypothetical protein